MSNITHIVAGEVPHDLLYLADEDDAQIESYRPSSSFWVAREDEQITGMIGLQKQTSEMVEIRCVAVYEKYQNTGIGTALLEKAISHSRQQGYRQIIIKTGNCGMAQIALYQRCGFRFHSINKDYFPGRYPEPIYEHDIQCLDQIVLSYRIYTQNEIDEAVQAYWSRFLAKNERYAGKPYEVWHFCYGEYLPNKLLGLVKTGKKTATSSARELYEEDEKIPEPGDLSVITYGNGMPGCIIETTNISIKPYNQIEAAEARLEGEGDLSLEFWRDAHEWFFKLEYEEKGLKFNHSIPVVFEQFRVIYDEDRGGPHP